MLLHHVLPHISHRFFIKFWNSYQFLNFSGWVSGQVSCFLPDQLMAIHRAFSRCHADNWLHTLSCHLERSFNFGDLLFHNFYFTQIILRQSDHFLILARMRHLLHPHKSTSFGHFILKSVYFLLHVCKSQLDIENIKKLDKIRIISILLQVVL
jgi:hypothetical protein